MTTVEQFLVALALVESRGNPLAWGDFVRPSGTQCPHPAELHGAQTACLPKAMGRWQVHPDRLFSELRKNRIEPQLGETWDHLIYRVLRAIWAHTGLHEGALSCAMYWHLGHWSGPGKPDWDITYAGKFLEALETVGGTP